MGRAKSNTKRRPKGKRGWRKIDTDALINPAQPLSLEEEQAQISKLRDSQLWKADTAPRKRKKLTKSQKKSKAKRKLKARGFIIDSLTAHNQSKAEMRHYKREQRLLSFKHSQKPNILKLPKQTAIITFKNKTHKKIKLSNHKNIAQNRKNLKNCIDYNNNNPYHLYKIKHCNKNTKNLPIKDLWDSNATSAKKRAKTTRIQNAFVTDSVISYPNPGESINPLRFQFYFLKWKMLELRAKHIFVKTYQREATMKWYKKNMDSLLHKHTDTTVAAMQKKANEMKELYLKHLSLYKQALKGSERNGHGLECKRQISKRERICDLRRNKRNVRKRRNIVRFKGHIYGSKYRFKQRVTGSMKGGNLDKCLRNTLHSGRDHPLTFMFNEMQKQNKIKGNRRNRFVFPKRKGFLGPLYKVQTRIGKLHHANVHNKYFSGIDDD